MLDESEFGRWFRQAEQTLRSAENDVSGGFWNWACFKAEQATQFAVKGLLRAFGEPAFGNSLTQLLADLENVGVTVPESVKIAGRELERQYIPTRYAYVFPSGSPYEFYGVQDAQAALAACQTILKFIQGVAECARSFEAQEGSAS
ncbi:MAG: HEPN domain-containing protein [Armatimonadota bacterium]|nr:HEPN domain-containing protein [Armatimonadota bacterium]MDW8026587.1 HEPN domain-containing protein [Armatimonadota bacterium]